MAKVVKKECSSCKAKIKKLTNIVNNSNIIKSNGKTGNT